jgi:DNA-binding MarR family transcriptional regulator
MAELDWNERAVPILEAVYRAEEQGERPNPDAIAAEIGLAPAVTSRTVAALVRAEYLDGAPSNSLGDTFGGYSDLVLREKGRRAIGQWPAGPTEALIASLEQRITDATDPEERSRLERYRDATLAFVRDVGSQVAGTIIGTASGGYTPF